MSANATLGVETRSGKRKRECSDASKANAGQAIPGLLNDIVIAHVLRSENFNDPADVARLKAVSHAMHDAVAATGCALSELCVQEAVLLGCLSAVERLLRRGILHEREREYLCHAAARSGQLEKLMLLRENNKPWDEITCAAAACGGHIEVIQWLGANDCPWDEKTCSAAAKEGLLEVLQWARSNGCSWGVATCAHAAYGGHLEILQWLRANGCPWDKRTLMGAKIAGHDAISEWAEANGAPSSAAGA